ncbi:MAG TPA: glycine cleavage system aminomethyltransferase GcvT [Steroidobacteraceae bacterium]|jgi:aminomethyltransferase|nr:glycine cleavage system aminomethyltransferase GcvT [Steroidobacteraceae bacterium]
MGLRTALYDTHVLQGAKIVDFGGWEMPLHYGSQIEEHHAVRRDAGMFDVSHMGVIDLHGGRVREFLRSLLANDVGRLKISGKALYSCMLLPSGGVIDDLIVYFISDNCFRVVVNAGTRDKDIAWIRRHAEDFAVSTVLREDLAMIAIQGPNAREKTLPLLPPPHRAAALELAPFRGAVFDSWFVARTGYTGEDGFEVMLPAVDAAKTWNALCAQGIEPAGLGARDTLRLEAGMNLYGNDMDENHHPLESGLAWTVAFEPGDRDFIGRQALENARHAAGGNELVGLLLEDRGVLRSHQKVLVAGTAANVGGSAAPLLGEVTSGTFSPTLNRSIALARVPKTAALGVQVEIRGKLHDASIIKPPFVRHGKALIRV